jgi:glutathione S-transferase
MYPTTIPFDLALPDEPLLLGPQVATADIAATCWTYRLRMRSSARAGCPVLADLPSIADRLLKP